LPDPCVEVATRSMSTAWASKETAKPRRLTMASERAEEIMLTIDPC